MIPLPGSPAAGCRTLPPAALEALALPLVRSIRAELDEEVGRTVEQEIARIAETFDPGRDFILGHGPEEAPDGFLIAVHGEGAGAGTSVTFWAVDPSVRGKGVGKALLCEAFREAARLGLPALRVRCLASSAAASRVLWECGFRVVDLVTAAFAGRRREFVVFEQEVAGGC
jgi:ribosomal protein S18 acetylase RimI-like enzyme